MHEFVWNQLKVVTDELNRLENFRTDCIRRGQSCPDIEGQIHELFVRRAHLSRALTETVSE